MPFLFLLFVAIATGALSAHAGRDEVRHSSEVMWRMEAFLAYALFTGLVLVPTAVYFYVFHGDWFLFYWVDTQSAPWLWGLLVVLVLLAAALIGFRLGAVLCRASRDRAARRVGVAAGLVGLVTWVLGWKRASVVGSHRQFARDYGLTGFFSSAAFYSGLIILVVLIITFTWLFLRIDRQTRDAV